MGIENLGSDRNVIAGYVLTVCRDLKNGQVAKVVATLHSYARKEHYLPHLNLSNAQNHQNLAAYLGKVRFSLDVIVRGITIKIARVRNFRTK